MENRITSYPYILRCALLLIAALCLLSISGARQVTFAQSVVVNRDRGHEMLKAIKSDIKNFYYDPTFHGVDIETLFKEADKKINDATSTGQIFVILGQLLSEFNDSHTFFIPPPLEIKVEYGWRMQIVGDNCYVISVKPGSDAEAKGLKVGDIIQSINGFEVTRESYWKIEYFFYDLMPVQKLNVVTQDLKGQVHQLEIATQTTKRPKIKVYEEGTPSLNPPEYYEEGDGLIVCKLRQFDLNDKEVDEMMKKIGQHKTLVLDLRRNPGGRLNMVKRMVGYFFDHDVKLGDTKSRKETLSYIAKTRGERSFKGKLVVLVDSKSASAAEIFSRIVQIEKRGIVIGDKTMGAVMAGGEFNYALGYRGILWDGMHLPSFYGASITVADFLMSDGKSLERVGVRPDIMLLPSQDMVAAHRDPVLASAAGIAGIKMNAEKAATLFSLESKAEASQ